MATLGVQSCYGSDASTVEAWKDFDFINSCGLDLVG